MMNQAGVSIKETITAPRDHRCDAFTELFIFAGRGEQPMALATVCFAADVPGSPGYANGSIPMAAHTSSACEADVQRRTI
jgi:hypothetical protein